MFGFFEGKTFKPATDIPSLAGKVIFVTGGQYRSSSLLVHSSRCLIGNTGLGFEAIRQLAAHEPSHIYLAARTQSKGEAAVAKIKAEYPSTNVTFFPLDLSSFQSISSAASHFKSENQRLDILMNNAGIMAVPPGETSEGYEIQFGTNHMGHALLTRLLMPTLLATTKQSGSDVRIVNLTSEGHNFARSPKILLDRSQLATCGAWTRYGYSKLANILFARGLAEHYPDITSVSVHPGVIATDLYLPNSQSNFIMRVGLKVAGSLRGTVVTGALNQLWAATGKKEDIVNGSYYTPIGAKTGGSACAQNSKLADDLWAYTEKELTAKGY